MAQKKKKKVSGQEKLNRILRRLTRKFNPYDIQCTLALIYLEYIRYVEPGYVYIPKARRGPRQKYVEPMTAEGRYWLKNYLGSNNLCLGMKKWLYEMMEDLEEGG